MPDPFLVALANCPMIGAKSMEKLITRFLSPENVWTAAENDVRQTAIGDDRVNAFLEFRKKTDPTSYLTVLEKNNIRVITKTDTEYPPLLKTIFDPPFVLFVKGAPLKEPAIAIVGSRAATEYGLKIATSFAKSLAERGISIVSGLAQGIDSAAYKGALEGNGHTVAILGGGLLSKNSLEKTQAAEEILSRGGTLLSEFSLHGSFASYHFPMRNRIIAGMSRLTVIVEAGLPSGSLTTAKAALEAARDVFAVPGPIDSPTSAGTNNLIKDGAFVATGPNDILLALGMKEIPSNPTPTPPRMGVVLKALPALEPLPATLYGCLQHGSLFADELSLKTKLTSSEVSRGLFELEILGLVRHTGGTRYEIT